MLSPIQNRSLLSGCALRRTVVGLLALSLVCTLLADTGWARVRLENICTVYGQREIHLQGLGLVVGLKGTGDGGGNPHTGRALAAALKLLNNPVLAANELKDANNVAIVLIEGKVPSTGLRRGQKIDCYISSLNAAKSLRGGRLLVSPVETAEIGDEMMVGLASGQVFIEDEEVPTTGLIPGGIIIQENFTSQFVDVASGNIVTLLINETHASFPVANKISEAINEEFQTEAGGVDLARAISPNAVQIKIPDPYLNSPVQFVALVLDVKIDSPQMQARVMVNPKLGTVVLSGEVEISPVVISHKNLTITVGADPGDGATGGFVGLIDQKVGSNGDQLQSLLNALNALKVPKEDIVGIVRELHRTGKLHATYEEH